MRRLFEACNSSQDRQHEQAADEPEWGHEIEIIAETFIEEFAQEMPGQAAPEILEGINQPQRETGHAPAADIHRRSRSENRVRRVRCEGDERKKDNGGVCTVKLRGQQDHAGLKKI